MAFHKKIHKTSNTTIKKIAEFSKPSSIKTFKTYNTLEIFAAFYAASTF